MSPARPQVYRQRGQRKPHLPMHDEAGRELAEDVQSCARPDPSLAVHLLAGLPTQAVQRGFEQAGEVLTVVPLAALFDADVGEDRRVGVLLPPFVEPSFLVESWQDCDFLPHRFGRPAHIASVSTFVDADHAIDHLASAAPLSAHGWGRSDLDRRTVADIVVGQIESATQLVLVGAAQLSEPLARRFGVLNPGASHIALHDGSGPDRLALARAFGSEARGAESRVAPRLDSTTERSVRVVPPWLKALQGDWDRAPAANLFVYRRTRPFDPARFAEWLADPPRDLVRGKGQVWLANEPDWSFGYSCAGSVHRLFPGGRWWASRTDGAWPDCASQRRRLLARWHPRFGDRRQELVFAGVDLDRDRLGAGLDACLLGEEAIDGALHASGAERPERLSTPGKRAH